MSTEFKKQMPTCGNREFNKKGYCTIQVTDKQGSTRLFYFADPEILKQNVESLNLETWEKV